jgi:hypothetical protein
MKDNLNTTHYSERLTVYTAEVSASGKLEFLTRR